VSAEEDDEIDWPRGTRLRYRLPRNTPRLRQIGCILAAVAILGTLSYFLLRYAWTHPGEDLWLMYVVGSGFGIVAVVLFCLGAVQQTLALRTPETVLEIDSAALFLGETARFFIRQPGTGSYESLRMNLVGEEQLRQRKTWNRRLFETINLLDSGAFEGDALTPFERVIEFDVPASLEPSNLTLHRRVRWQIEVWGRLRGRADFQHVYPISVLPPEVPE
jgi:hypothetical protein